MGKVKYNSLSPRDKKILLGDFYSMISLLSTRSEVESFFKDLLTLSEVTMISRRIQIAKMLLRGKTYSEIVEKLGAGNTTINQVEKWLNNGFGGYRTILKKYEKLNKREFKKQIEDDMSDISIKKLIKSHPGHFFLFNLFDR